ncbi:putative signal transducing protein [Desulfohalovibrio reitneri]|uniref:putative signal transducing protein n=1 Tax=Desulfohalovibrio reitneri TaxID=1307759 RepID=UPI000ABFEACA|nr:DUF2007 domain-containing protein [Desulfohalovibrio reitneri]
MEEFPIVFTSLHSWEVRLMQQELEAEGIPAVVEDEGVVGANWLYANAVGGVKLRVHAEDAERAGRVVHEFQGKDASGTVSRCPACGGSNVRGERWPVLGVIASYFLLGVPFLFRKQWRCRDCGHTWRG